MHKIRSGGRYVIDPAKHGDDTPRLVEKPTAQAPGSGEAIAHAGDAELPPAHTAEEA